VLALRVLPGRGGVSQGPRGLYAVPPTAREGERSRRGGLPMQRCDSEQADLVLDGWGWCFTALRDAVTTYRKLAIYKGARWSDWTATLRRLHAAAPFEEQQWFARLPQRQRPWDQDQPAAAPAAPSRLLLRVRPPDEAP